MVTAESLHDGGFVEELDPLSQAGRFVDRLDGHARLRIAFDDVFGDSFVHHAEGALTELSEQCDLLPGHLPLIRNVHYTTQVQMTVLTERTEGTNHRMMEKTTISFLLSPALKYSGFGEVMRSPKGPSVCL